MNKNERIKENKKLFADFESAMIQDLNYIPVGIIRLWPEGEKSGVLFINSMTIDDIKGIVKMVYDGINAGTAEQTHFIVEPFKKRED